MKTSILAAALLIAASTMSAGTAYLDLSGQANSGYEDDGIADNGKGGWTDEGINDMFIYPPVKTGEICINAHKFKVVDPAANNGNSIIILKGAERCKDKPESVAVKVPGVKSAYVYFLQNSAAQVKGEQKNFVVAKYTVKYSDGSSEQIDIRDGIEIRQWWTGAWYDNSGNASWPIFMGRNLYSQKWSQFIGAWAMQWKNPHPEKEISEIVFKSEGKSLPVIWAVTFDDEDYHASPDIKKHYVRPDGVPAGYFDAKQEIENRKLLDAMKADGYAQGLRRIELVRPDLVALTFDSLVSGGAGLAAEKAAALQREDRFEISCVSGDDPGLVSPCAPEKVGRHSYAYDTVSIGPFPNNTIYWHCYYLKLAKPLKPGSKYLFSAKGLPEHAVSKLEMEYSDKKTSSPAIKINQAAYSSKSSSKFAYLGWWAGDMGPVDYSAYKTFSVVDEKTGEKLLSGEIRKRVPAAEPKTAPEPEVSGEEVFELDISALSQPGRYRIEIPGFAVSDGFGVGGEGMAEVCRTVMRGFLFQRCGCELTDKVCGYPRHACHLKNYESGHLVYGVNEKYENGIPLVQNKPAKADDPIKEFRGGYHDAGDYDLFYGHLTASSQTLIAYEFNPDAFKELDLGIPESGNGVPDILDEVEWGLKFYHDTQQEDGAVFSGRGNDEDYSYKEWRNEFKKWKESNPEWKKYGDLPPYQNFFPCCGSSATYAAVAAQLSRCLRSFDKVKADHYLATAEKAYAWADKHHADGYEKEGITYCSIEWKKALVWAASELFKTTGKKEYSDAVIMLADKKEDAFKAHWSQAYRVPFFQWAYASCSQPGTDEKLRASLVQAICRAADGIAKSNDKRAYRMGSGRETGGWGSLVGGGYYGYICLMAYMLTNEGRYLDAASLNADYQLGANPLSRSFISGLGTRPPLHPEIRSPLYNKDKLPCAGIPVFGPGGGEKSLGDVYPPKVPLWRCWLDNRTSALHSEFTVASTMGEAAMLYGILWGIENKK